LSPEKSKQAMLRARQILATAMEKRIEAAAPKAK
jgi:hypothetical protein